jgi:Ca2+-binding EF-hand superfamily protein
MSIIITIYVLLEMNITQNTEEEINELIAELDPDENGYVDWIQWVTQLISVSQSLLRSDPWLWQHSP